MRAFSLCFFDMDSNVEGTEGGLWKGSWLYSQIAWHYSHLEVYYSRLAAFYSRIEKQYSHLAVLLSVRWRLLSVSHILFSFRMVEVHGRCPVERSLELLSDR